MEEYSRQFGGVKTELATDDTVTGRIFMIEAYGDVTLTAIEGYGAYAVEGWDGETLLDGRVLYGDFSSIEFVGTLNVYYTSTI